MDCDLSLERFWKNVDKTPGHGPRGNCWLKPIGNKRTGYSQFWYNGTNHLAHRWLFRRLNGQLLKRQQVMHSCDVRNCVNPAHLQKGTPKQNMHDMIVKGRNKKHERHPMAKLSWEQVSEIRQRRAAGETIVSLGKRFGVHHSQISNVANQKHWKEAA